VGAGNATRSLYGEFDAVVGNLTNVTYQIFYCNFNYFAQEMLTLSNHECTTVGSQFSRRKKRI
jgi:hypothetical protein